MWWIIIGTVIAIIGFCLVTNCEDDEKVCGAILSVIGLLILSIVGCALAYNRGKPVILSNMPYSLRQGTVYTVVGVDAGYAIVTDETKSDWNFTNHRYDGIGEGRTMWLVELAQTNVVVGKKYMIADGPDNPIDTRQWRMFVEVHPGQ